MAPDLCLLVLRCRDIHTTRTFYECLGFSFQEEKHGKGPVHFSSMMADGCVMELYPIRGDESPTRNRLGFIVPDPQRCIDKLLKTGLDLHLTTVSLLTAPADSVPVAVDPDGRHVELHQKLSVPS